MAENVKLPCVSDLGLDVNTDVPVLHGEMVNSTSPPSSENNYSLEELLQKHRKERKEFQGKVQSIRKSVAKADKKKKKDAAEQIAQLELELERQQNEELHQLEVKSISSRIETIGEGKPVQQRVSKAQKRREKKNVKSKERELEIQAQEVENIHGARNMETQAIKQILRERNLMIHEIPSDGNCLYCAIDHQWQLANGEALGLRSLRTRTAEHLRANKSDFLPFMVHPETGDLLTDGQYEEYCLKVAHSPAWGGEVELRALSHVLQCCIEVVQSSGPSVVVGKEYRDGKTVTLTYHRHMYGLGEHYNSVKPYEEAQEDEGTPLPSSSL